MDKELLIHQLKAKPDLTLLVSQAMESTGILNLLFEIVRTEPSSIKYVSSKIIRLVSEQQPELIYPHFEEVARWLHHKNSFIKWDAILTLSNLCAVDDDDKFLTIYQDYFGLIQDPQMITAANVIGNAWKIVIAKPELENDITRRLLDVPDTVYFNKGEPSPECNCIVCGQVLDSFEHYFERSKNQTLMIQFAEAQLCSSRKAVVKNAEKFLRLHSDRK